MYTVSQFAELAGITVRTLRYYDSIGLLLPEKTGINGYRYYGEDSVMLLQQILFYRELGMPLKEIRRVLSDPDFNIADSLESHRTEIAGRIRRLQSIAVTIERTIKMINGEEQMEKKEMFKALTEEQREIYTSGAEKKYDPATVRAADRKWKSYSESEKKKIMDEGNEIYSELVEAIDMSPESGTVQNLIQRWRDHMSYFWTPEKNQLLAIAEGYRDDPAFRKSFDEIHPELAEFMVKAVRIYSWNHS